MAYMIVILFDFLYFVILRCSCIEFNHYTPRKLCLGGGVFKGQIFCLIWVYTDCQYLFYRTLGMNLLIAVFFCLLLLSGLGDSVMMQKIVGSNPGLGELVAGKLCQPSSKWVPFSNRGRILQQNEMDGSAIRVLCPLDRGPLTRIASGLLGAFKTWENPPSPLPAPPPMFGLISSLLCP